MAYVHTQSTHRRTLTIGAVATLHVALGYALITGFAATVIEKIDILQPTRTWKADPPPPAPEPTAEPRKATDRQEFTAPRPDLGLGPRKTTATEFTLTPLTPPTGLPGPVDPGPLQPSPPSGASFTPRGAMPLGSPGKWVSTDDYPASELRLEHEGVSRFPVTVGADGRVNNCEIVSSSGFPALDRAACANVAKRARFKPATDNTGATVGGNYTSAVKWDIPG
jgi:protein TonB